MPGVHLLKGQTSPHWHFLIKLNFSGETYFLLILNNCDASWRSWVVKLGSFCLPCTLILGNLIKTALLLFIDSIPPKIRFSRNNDTSPGFLHLFRAAGWLPSYFSLGAVKSIWQVWFMTQPRHQVPVGKGLHVWACLEPCARVSVSMGDLRSSAHCSRGACG